MAKLLGRVWSSRLGSVVGRSSAGSRSVAVMLITIQETTAVAEISSRKRNQGSRSGWAAAGSGSDGRPVGRRFQGLSSANHRERKTPERPSVAAARSRITSQTRGSVARAHVRSQGRRSNMARGVPPTRGRRSINLGIGVWGFRGEGRQIGTDRGRRLDGDDAGQVFHPYPTEPAGPSQSSSRVGRSLLRQTEVAWRVLTCAVGRDSRHSIGATDPRSEAAMTDPRPDERIHRARRQADAAGVARRLPRPDRRRDDPGQQPGVGRGLPAAPPCRVGRLDADGPGLPVLPAHRRASPIPFSFAGRRAIRGGPVRAVR